MSGVSKVYFNAPVVGEILNPIPPPKEWNHTEINEVVTKLQADGWGDRAVVVKVGQHNHYHSSPYNWGIVVDVSRYKHINEPYAPIVVKWLTGSISKHWPQDLFMIHKSLFMMDVDEIVAEQNK